MPKTRILVVVAVLALLVGALLLLAPRAGKLSEEGTASSAGQAAPSRGPWSPRRIAKFDMHTHIEPEMAVPAQAFLESHGIGRVVNLSGGVIGDGLEDSMTMSRMSAGYYVIFANVNFEGIGMSGWAAREVQQLERAKTLGVKGVKIAKNLGLGVQFPDGRRVPVDDPVLDPLFEAMARLHLPLAIHTGDPKAFFDPMGPANERMDELRSHPGWSFANRTIFPTWQALYGEFEGRVKRSPNTTIIGVHFGNAPEEPDRVMRMLKDYPNLYVDTAARVPEIGRKPELVRKVIMAYPDRVLFGTDVQIGQGALVLGAGDSRGHSRATVDHFFRASWEFFESDHKQFAHPTPIQGNWKIDGIELPENVLEKVYHANAERLLNLPPTPIPEAGDL